MDPRTRYLRQLRRLRRSARRWSVLGGGFAGAAAVLTPYHGLGLPDAAWAAAAGAAGMLAVWRWRDLRELSAQPAPPPLAARPARLDRWLARLPLDEVRRAQAQWRLRGTAAAAAWSRLDRAAVTLSGLAGRLGGPAEGTLEEAAAAEYGLRDLAERAASVERALRLAPPDAREDLDRAHYELLTQLNDGVAAYERLVAAAAGYVAEDGRNTPDHRLTETADLLRGVAAGLAELRRFTVPGTAGTSR